jgi:RNA-binding protein PNO1
MVDPSEIEGKTRHMKVSSVIDEEGEVGDQQMQEEEIHPTFPKLSATAAAASGEGGNRIGRIEYRRVRCPPHRYTPLREHWEQILTPLVEHLKLQVRFFLSFKRVKEKGDSFPTVSRPMSVERGSLRQMKAGTRKPQ